MAVPAHDQALAAPAAVVDAFARTDTEAYFAVEVKGERDEYDERETIVFADTDRNGTLMGAHERLSTGTSRDTA